MIEGIRAGTPTLGNSQSLPSNELGKDAFMSLLVEQMKNQDPMAPTSNDQFIAQLAQFSSLEEMQGVNENLVALAYLQQNNALMAQLTDSSALIGKNVEYTDLSSGELTSGIVDSVRLEDGTAVLRIDGKDVPLTTVSAVLGEGESAGDTQDEGQEG